MPIEYDLSGFNAMIDRLETQAQRGYADPEMEHAGTLTVMAYADALQERFLSASHGDGTWHELAKSTIARRAAMAGGNSPANVGKRVKKAAGDMSMTFADEQFPILFITGQLYASLGIGASGNVFKITEDGIFYGSDARSPKNGSDYVAANQYGTDTKYARPIFIDASDEIAQFAAERHAAAVQAAANGASGAISSDLPF